MVAYARRRQANSGGGLLRRQIQGLQSSDAGLVLGVGKEEWTGEDVVRFLQRQEKFRKLLLEALISEVGGERLEV